MMKRLMIVTTLGTLLMAPALGAETAARACVIPGSGGGHVLPDHPGGGPGTLQLRENAQVLQAAVSRLEAADPAAYQALAREISALSDGEKAVLSDNLGLEVSADRLSFGGGDFEQRMDAMDMQFLRQSGDVVSALGMLLQLQGTQDAPSMTAEQLEGVAAQLSLAQSALAAAAARTGP
jgi:hypothetical protein